MGRNMMKNEREKKRYAGERGFEGQNMEFVLDVGVQLQPAERG